jgi:hypothetical protein
VGKPKKIQPMKHLKYFENLNINIGEFVICEDEENKIIANFLSNNIGQITEPTGGDNKDEGFFVEYKNIPEYIIMYFGFNNKENCRPFTVKEIIHHAPNYNSLLVHINQKKYNL